MSAELGARRESGRWKTLRWSALRPRGTLRVRVEDPATLSLRETADVAIAALAALSAVAIVALLPPGNALRLWFASAILFLVPGYLLLQAVVVPAARAENRLLHLAASVGVSPGLVGILALSTALVPGGFKPGPIVLIVTVACLSFAAIAVYRRAMHKRKAFFDDLAVPADVRDAVA